MSLQLIKTWGFSTTVFFDTPYSNVYGELFTVTDFWSKSTTNVLEQTPPELSGDIVEKGIILTGGGALLNGLKEILEKELNVPVIIAESPLTCVVEGTGVLLDNIKLLEEDK